MNTKSTRFTEGGLYIKTSSEPLRKSFLEDKISKEINDAKNIKNRFFIALISARDECNLACKYCFIQNTGAGSHKPNGRVMDNSVVGTITKEFMQYFDGNNSTVEFLFHGPEITQDVELIKSAMEMQKKIYSKLGTGRPLYRRDCKEGERPLIVNSLQSNATTISEKLISILCEGDFRSLGVSLDGPKIIHDANRIYKNGQGTFDKIMDSISYARENNISVAGIAVLTKTGLNRIEEIYNFFKENKINFRLNGVSTQKGNNSDFAITASEYANAIKELIDIYVNDPCPTVSVRNLDHYIRMIYSNLLIFKNEGNISKSFELYGVPDIFSVTCQNMMAAIDPDGNVYPCERILGVSEYCYGNIKDGLQKILDSKERLNVINRVYNLPEECSSCEIFNLCYGGCLASAYYNSGNLFGKDPFCEAYKRIFSYIKDIIIKETM